MGPQENLKFPSMARDLKFKINIVPLYLSEMLCFLTLFGKKVRNLNMRHS